MCHVLPPALSLPSQAGTWCISESVFTVRKVLSLGSGRAVRQREPGWPCGRAATLSQRLPGTVCLGPQLTQTLEALEGPENVKILTSQC